jgi:hypothetical protein
LHRRLQLRLNLQRKKIPQPPAAGGEFRRFGWITVRHPLDEPHGAQRKTRLKMLVPALSQNEFRAATPDIQQQ